MSPSQLEHFTDDIASSDPVIDLCERIDREAGIVKEGWMCLLIATMREAVCIGIQAGLELGRVEALESIRRSHLSEN